MMTRHDETGDIIRESGSSHTPVVSQREDSGLMMNL